MAGDEVNTRRGAPAFTVLLDLLRGLRSEAAYFNHLSVPEIEMGINSKAIYGEVARGHRKSSRYNRDREMPREGVIRSGPIQGETTPGSAEY